MNCARQLVTDALDPVCPRCGSALTLTESTAKSVGRQEVEDLQPGVWRYRAFLPAVPAEGIVSLGEGGTPLLKATRLGCELGLTGLHLKDESRNPTGSFIDRGSTVLISLARRSGVKECRCVTTGNLGASLAAYCARAGIASRITIHPNTDRGKLYQMLAYGAEVEADQRRRAEAREPDVLRVSAGNPYLLEGEKTTCFEVVHEMGWKVPDVIVLPVGTGGHLSMTWRAIIELRDAGLIDHAKCRLVGAQMAGSQTALPGTGSGSETRERRESFTELEESEPFFLSEAVRAISQSEGAALSTTAEDTVRATGLLARTEGIFAEPASASVVAVLEAAARRGVVKKDDTVVCVVTGSGLKDTKAVSRLARTARRVPVREERLASSVQVGDTKLAILKMLQKQRRYGYEIWQGLSEERKITTASVYQHLSELEGLALVRKSTVVTARGRERIPYELTRKGADFVRLAGKMNSGG